MYRWLHQFAGRRYTNLPITNYVLLICSDLFSEESRETNAFLLPWLTQFTQVPEHRARSNERFANKRFSQLSDERCWRVSECSPSSCDRYFCRFSHPKQNRTDKVVCSIWMASAAHPPAKTDRQGTTTVVERNMRIIFWESGGEEQQFLNF